MNSIRFQIALFLLFFGLCSLSYAQEGILKPGFSQTYSFLQPAETANVNDSIRSHFAIKINPLQWLWDDIRLMVEVPINKNNSLQFRVGYRNSAINPYDKKYCYEKDVFWDNLTNQNITYQYKAEGYNVGVGFNHYFKKNFYLAPSLLYKRYRFSYAPPEHWWFTEHFGIDSGVDFRDNFYKTIYAIELRGGKQLYYKCYLFDFFVGVGIRNRILDTMDIYYCNGSMNNFQQSHGDSYHESMQAPSFHAGVNIGLSF